MYVTRYVQNYKKTTTREKDRRQNKRTFTDNFVEVQGN